MKMKYAILLTLLGAACFGQSLTDQDLQYGLVLHGQMASRVLPPDQTPESGRDVFQKLAASPAAQHSIRKYLRQIRQQQAVADYQYRIALGDQTAGRQLAAFLIAAKIANGKVDRDAENAA